MNAFCVLPYLNARTLNMRTAQILKLYLLLVTKLPITQPFFKLQRNQRFNYNNYLKKMAHELFLAQNGQIILPQYEHLLNSDSAHTSKREKEETSCESLFENESKDDGECSSQGIGQELLKEKGGFKDAYARVWNKIESLFKRNGKQVLLKQIKQEHGIDKKNRETLNLLYVHPKARKLIAKWFLSGKYRREVILSKRKCSITEKSQTNTARNLLKAHNFDCFAFIQGGSDNRSSLRLSIEKEE